MTINVLSQGAHINLDLLEWTIYLFGNPFLNCKSNLEIYLCKTVELIKWQTGLTTDIHISIGLLSLWKRFDENERVFLLFCCFWLTAQQIISRSKTTKNSILALGVIQCKVNIVLHECVMMNKYLLTYLKVSWWQKIEFRIQDQENVAV